MQKLTIVEASRYTGLSIQTIRRMIKRGKLMATLDKTPRGNLYYITKQALDDIQLITQLSNQFRIIQKVDNRQTKDLSSKSDLDPLINQGNQTTQAEYRQDKDLSSNIDFKGAYNTVDLGEKATLSNQGNQPDYRQTNDSLSNVGLDRPHNTTTLEDYATLSNQGNQPEYRQGENLLSNVGFGGTSNTVYFDDYTKLEPAVRSELDNKSFAKREAGKTPVKEKPVEEESSRVDIIFSRLMQKLIEQHARDKEGLFGLLKTFQERIVFLEEKIKLLEAPKPSPARSPAPQKKRRWWKLWP